MSYDVHDGQHPEQHAEPTLEEQQEWLRRVCEEIGVDFGLLEVGLVLELTKQVAHRFVRPMAPVSAYALGIAVGSGAVPVARVDQSALVERIVGTLPLERN